MWSTWQRILNDCHKDVQQMFIKNSGEQCMEKVRILRKRFFKKNQKEMLELRKTINALRKKKK